MDRSSISLGTVKEKVEYLIFFYKYFYLYGPPFRNQDSLLHYLLVLLWPPLDLICLSNPLNEIKERVSLVNLNYNYQLFRENIGKFPQYFATAKNFWFWISPVFQKIKNVKNNKIKIEYFFFLLKVYFTHLNTF